MAQIAEVVLRGVDAAGKQIARVKVHGNIVFGESLHHLVEGAGVGGDACVAAVHVIHMNEHIALTTAGAHGVQVHACIGAACDLG